MNTFLKKDKDIFVTIGKIALYSFISVVLCGVVYTLGEWLALYIPDASKFDLHWGITLKYFMVFLSVITIIENIVLAIVPRKTYYIVLTGTCVLSIFMSIFIGSITIRPYRTLLLCFSCIFSVLFPSLRLIFKKKKKMKHNEKH